MSSRSAAGARSHARRRRTRRARIVIIAGAVVAVAVVFGAWMHLDAVGPREKETRAPAAAAPSAAAPDVVPSAMPAAPPPITLADGSVVSPIGADTRIETGEITPDAVTIRLRSGRARFQVAHRNARVFRVVSGEVSIVDLGTEFEVTRDDESSVVEVFDGRVRVEWRGGAADVIAGERRRFPPPEMAGGKPSSARSSAPKATRPSVGAVSPPDGAHDVEAMLASADDARFRGDPAGAAEQLRRVVDEHATDPRAALAAFTLGRVYLDELNDAARAARAFARARALAPTGQLAEDALAREVEALARTGDTQGARDRAKAYFEEYPDGRRAAEVRHSAGLP